MSGRSTSLDIAAAPEAVWDLVADVTRVGEWSPETVSAEWVDGSTGPVVGARFKGHNKRKVSWSTTCTVTAAERGRVFAFSVGKGETTWAYRFEPTAGGETRVTESFEIVKAPGLVGRLSYKPSTGVSWEDREDDLLAGMQQTLARLKAAAETPQRAATGW